MFSYEIQEAVFGLIHFEYPKHFHQNLFCLFYSFSLVVFWLIIGQELETPHYVLLDSICPKHSRWLFSVTFYCVMLLTRNIFPSQLLFYPSKEARDVQTCPVLYQPLCLLRLPLGQADLVSLLYKLKLFYSAFSTSAPKHKSTIFGSFVTRRFYTFCLLLLFNTIRFHHYYVFMLYNYCLITVTTIWNISIMAAI